MEEVPVKIWFVKKVTAELKLMLFAEILLLKETAPDPV